jgi:hypothetical protein
MTVVNASWTRNDDNGRVTHFRTMDDLIEAERCRDATGLSPLPLSVIPNYMGINLVSVEGVSWTEEADGQLVSLTIHFIPEKR